METKRLFKQYYAKCNGLQGHCYASVADARNPKKAVVYNTALACRAMQSSETIGRVRSYLLLKGKDFDLCGESVEE